MSSLLAPAAPAVVAPATVTTLHLIGAGPVGRAFLGHLVGRRDVRLVAFTDRSGTTYARHGLDPREIRQWKADGGRAADHLHGRALETNVALDLIGADVVVDATSTDPQAAAQALTRVQAALRGGGRVVLAGKDALSLGATRLPRERLGCNAVFGGTGARLLGERHALADCDEIVAVPNASTTEILTAIEEGADVDAGIRAARSKGVLEADATLDLDGSDAAVKLVGAAQLLWGARVCFEDVARASLHDVDSTWVQHVRATGGCVRLVARARRGGPLQVAYEALARDAALAVPGDRVAYEYRWADGRRQVHIGCGLGPAGTGEALWQDVAHVLCARRVA